MPYTEKVPTSMNPEAMANEMFVLTAADVAPDGKRHLRLVDRKTPRKDDCKCDETAAVVAA